MAVLTSGLERAFERFGAVLDELPFDQMRAVVLSDDRLAGGELILTRSSCGSRRTGDFGPAPADLTAPGPKARWSARSATCGTASSTLGALPTMQI